MISCSALIKDARTYFCALTNDLPTMTKMWVLNQGLVVDPEGLPIMTISDLRLQDGDAIVLSQA